MKQTANFAYLILAALLIPASCASPPRELPPEAPEAPAENDGIDDNAAVIPLPPQDGPLPVSAFGEVWAYVVAGREGALRNGLPVSDICYDVLDIDSTGKLIGNPVREKLGGFSGRIHLMVRCDSFALTHVILKPGSPERKALIEDLAARTRNFDGLQIDFEYILQRDASAFLSFLAELRLELRDKTLSIAMKAAYRKSTDIMRNYERVRPLVDRILVMAYDEHWSTSEPGPIASLPWCKRVAEYCLQTVGGEKLIMGIPFYGRAWGRPNPSRALLYSGVREVIAGNGVAEIRRENGIPVFDYEVRVSVTVFYEDEYSLAVRMDMYKTLGVGAVGFWRLGQETPAVWDVLRLE
jgi:hypothetical protein